MLVLNEVDKLSKEAQHSLRRTMEKYSAACRLILCCNSASKVIEAVRSRCLNIRINSPSREKVCVNVPQYMGLIPDYACQVCVLLKSLHLVYTRGINCMFTFVLPDCGCPTLCGEEGRSDTTS